MKQRFERVVHLAGVLVYMSFVAVKYVTLLCMVGCNGDAAANKHRDNCCNCYKRHK